MAFTNPFRELLGVEVLDGGADGEAAVAVEARPELMQSRGILHGGVVAALIDCGTGEALRTLLAEGERMTTVDLNVSFVRGVQPGRVEARGRVVRRGRTIGFCTADIFDSTGELVATGRATFQIRRRDG